MTCNLIWTASPPFDALGALPIRLRALDGDVVSTGVSGNALQVPPGQYLLCVTMPNGREVIGRTTVEVGPTCLKHLPTLEVEMARAFDLTAVAPRLAGALPLDGIPVGRWDGSLFDCWSQDGLRITPAEDLIIGFDASAVSHSSAPDTLLLLPSSAGLTGHVLPYDRLLTDHDRGGCDMLVSLAPDRDRLALSSSLGAAVNALFRFVDHSLLAESKRLSLAMVAEKRSASMLQLVVALYVLLRANELSTVDAAVERLLELAPDMPDTHIVCAEIRARQGRHEEAVVALRAGRECGCPWFRSGTSYLLERLRLYLEVDAGPSTFTLRADDRDRAVTWQASLQRLTDRMNMTSLFTEFDIDRLVHS